MANIESTAQPSFYYLLIAQTCFQRGLKTVDKGRSNLLYETGRNYLEKAKLFDLRAPHSPLPYAGHPTH